jgi:PAS domain S-box-containing protein
MSSHESFQSEFCRRLDCPWHLSQLFDYLPDTYFYAKNLNEQFVMVNQALASMLGLEGPEEMIGKTDHDFSSCDLADQYVAEDQRVIRSGQPLINQAWLIPNHRGELRWYLSSKIPLLGDGGSVIGIAGAMRDVEKAGVLLAPYREMEELLRCVFTRYAEDLDVAQLARLAGLSVSQLDRRFKRLFQMTPREFVLRVRLNAACRMLASTEDSITDIALRTGFYDQSHFTKHFRRQIGVTPRSYRGKYGAPSRRSAELARLRPEIPFGQ